MKTYFDVGANNGSRFYDDLVKDQNDLKIYMFEPTPYLCGIIKEKYKDLKNWMLVEKAVSNFNGKATLNIAGESDWGCSSLLDWHPNKESTWPKRDGLTFTDKIEVEVIRLDGFIKENNIKTIDYYHSDCQGSDKLALEGLGEFSNIICRGQVESANESPLYEGSPQKEDFCEYLKSLGFKYNVINLFHECDIEFFR